MKHTNPTPESAAAFKDYVSQVAQELAYSPAEIAAGIAFSDRAARRSHPPGTWDKAGRYYANERTQSVVYRRSPSRAFPHSQMQAARTAAHCAEVYNADCRTHVLRIGTALNRLMLGAEKAAVISLLTKGVRKRRAERGTE